jgi:hypothetical protein
MVTLAQPSTPTPTQAPQGTPSTALQKGVGWGIAVGMALQGGDAMQTAFCLGTEQCKEGNPVLAPFEDHPFWFGFTKLGIASAVSYAALRLRKPHPYWALLIVGMEIGLETYAVIHNNALFPPSEANGTAVTMRRR